MLEVPVVLERVGTPVLLVVLLSVIPSQPSGELTTHLLPSSTHMLTESCAAKWPQALCEEFAIQSACALQMVFWDILMQNFDLESYQLTNAMSGKVKHHSLSAEL